MNMSSRTDASIDSPDHAWSLAGRSAALLLFLTGNASCGGQSPLADGDPATAPGPATSSVVPAEATAPMQATVPTSPATVTPTPTASIPPTVTPSTPPASTPPVAPTEDPNTPDTGAGGTTDPGTGATPPPEPGVPPVDSDTLRATGRLIGAALSGQFLTNAAYQDVAAREFNYVTAENEMKWDATEPTQGSFNFARADSIVDFAEANGMQVKGHTLVWHSQLPAWAQNLTGAQAVRAAMTNHVQGVLEHYQGRASIIAWDVVNEAVDDATAADRDGLRASVFYDNLGETFIDEAFQLARAADPNILLFYNDYGIEGLGGKSDRAFDLIQRLLSRGVPIDGVGLQMHVDTTFPTASDIRANIQRYQGLGLLVNISELDVNVCSVAGSTAAKFEAQQERYTEVALACLQEANCHGITLWGVADPNSWLNGFAPCTAGQTGNPWPLLFDDSYQPKPAFGAMLDALLTP